MAHVMNSHDHPVRGSTDWKAGIWAGIIAGIAFMMLEMIMVRVIAGDSPWKPPHMMAAMVLGRDVLPEPGQWAPFDAKVMMVAMMIHLPLSIVYGLIGAWLCHKARIGGAILIGVGYGIAIFIVNFFIVAPAAFPWFTQMRNPMSAVGHAMFGLILALCYVWLRKEGPQSRDAIAAR